MDVLRRGKMRTTGDDHLPLFIMFPYFLLNMFFHTIQFPGRQELTIGQVINPIFISADAGKLLYMTVPGGQLLITDRPFHGKSIPAGGLKFIPAPALRLPGPEQGLAAYLVAPYPIIGFLLYIGVLFIFYKEMVGGFAGSITLADDRIVFLYGKGQSPPVPEVRGILQRRGIILQMFHIPAPFQE